MDDRTCNKLSAEQEARSMGDGQGDWYRTSSSVDRQESPGCTEGQPTGIERDQKGPMDARSTSAQEAVERILLAYKDKDYFRMLGLEYPDVDALGRPVWHVTPNDVSRAYRRLSILVHPDRNPGEDAREAFEALNESHKKLKDPEQIDTILKDNVGRALERRNKALASGTLQERVDRMAKQQEEEQKLRQEESASLNDEILEQMKERQARHALKKKRAEERQRYRVHKPMLHEQEDAGMTMPEEKAGVSTKRREQKEEEDDGDEARRRRRKTMARRQKKRKPEDDSIGS